MRILTVDIGTNSTLYLIADVEESGLKIVERGIEGNRLGAQVMPGGEFSGALIEHNRGILERIVRRAVESGCDVFAGVGTAALRKADGRDAFLKMASENGLPVEVISDEREASLAWKGVFGASGAVCSVGLLDLGGGSTELSTGKGTEPEWTSSVPVGAVSLAREFFKSDPPVAYDIECAKDYIRRKFDDWKQLKLKEVIGTAGTVTALAAIEYGVIRYVPDLINGYRLSSDQVKLWCDRLTGMTLEERKNIPGMPAVRAEFISAGALILTEIVRLLGGPTISVNDRGVMFGLAYEVFSNAKRPEHKH